MSEQLVIVGNGMATARLVEELTSRAPGRYAIAVIGEEPALAYNRVLLSSLLAGEVVEQDLELKSRGWWEAHGVTLVYGRRATKIDARLREVHLDGGTRLGFSKLVLATGSEAIRLPLPGADICGVLTFRDLNDVEAMIARAGARKRVVVIGGGLLGLEAAYGLKKAGATVTVVHLMDRLMERQLDAPAAAMLKAELEVLGIEVLLKAQSTAIEGSNKTESLRLADGRLLPAELIVMAAGIRPRAELARQAGLEVKRGIVIDDRMQTSEPGIYALGECAEHRGTCYGLVEPAYEQARMLARHLAGETAQYCGSLLATNLKVSGVNVFSAGDFIGAPGTEPIVLSDPEHGIYRKLVIEQGRLAGAVLLGDTADALWYLDLIRSAAPIGVMRDDLVFGRAFCDVPDESGAVLHAEAA
jgi:nitrite reductase [NAD(P)H] large subunit